MLLRDRLLARMAEMSATPDYVVLAAEVLGIRNAPPALAKRLVDQALVVEDHRELWLATGARLCADAPAVPGVYVLRDSAGRALYVGKANNIRRRLQTHFAERRWRHLKPAFARAASVEWHRVGSEIEALLLEAEWIGTLTPVANVQVSAPAMDRRAIPALLLRDTLLVLPSAAEGAVELLAVRMDATVLLQRALREGTGLAARATALRRFFAGDARDTTARDGRVLTGLAPLVLSWLAGRGASATRLDPHDVPSAREFQRRLQLLFDDTQLFSERLVIIRSTPPGRAACR